MPITEEIPARTTESEDEDPGDTTADPQAREEDAEQNEAPETEEEPEEGADEGSEDSEDSEEVSKPEGPGELEITIEGDEPQIPPKASKAFARIRKEAAEARREAAELKRELETLKRPQNPAVVDPGPEPTMESCGYDENVLKTKHVEWIRATERKAQLDKQAAYEAEEGRRTWEGTRQTCQTSRDDIAKRVPDYETAEKEFMAALNPLQQGIVMHLTQKNYGKLVVALGRNPERLKALAAEKDNARFIQALTRLEDKVKTKDKTQAPPKPETPVARGGAPRSTGGADPYLEKLRARAEKTGDYTEVNRYKHEQRERARS